MKKRLQILGFILRAQSILEKAALWKSAQKHWSLPLANQQIRPIIDSIFDFSKVEEAHQSMLENRHFGKIILRMD